MGLKKLGMKVRRQEVYAAGAIIASASAVCFASGRGIVLFFTQLGHMAWPGILIAGCLFGWMMHTVMHFARKTGAENLPEVFRRLTGTGCGRAAGVMYGLLTALVAAVMVENCAGIGAIVLPVKKGALTGAAFALLAAVVICLDRRRLLPVLGLATVCAAILFYAGLMLDVRPVAIHIKIRTVFRLRGSAAGCILLAMMHASLNASVASASAAEWGCAGVRPTATATLAGTMMTACLACANGAMLRGGEAICAQTMPTVILAARWGIWGFWLCSGFMYLSSILTLSESLNALSALLGWTCDRRPRA